MKKIASLKQLQLENPSGLLELGESIPYVKYCHDNYSSGLGTKKENCNFGCEIFRSKKLRREDEDFYRFPASSQNSLDALFKVQTESGGDLLVVFVADILKDGHVQAHLILHDEAWQNILLNPKQAVVRVEQFYSYVLEEQWQISA